jgi:GNAT superfamily N-acetyltransferase
VSASAFRLRNAAPEDAPEIARLVRALAEYEKLEHECRGTADDFRRALFQSPPHAFAMLAEADGRVVGFALWFRNFSTFAARHGLYLEDLYVEPAYRGRGIGRAFFRAIAQRAIAEGCARLEWSVLDWNAPAVAFYRALGAEPMSDWTVQRLSGPALAALAKES